MTNDKLLEICEKATPGPWTWGDGWKVADEIGSVYSNDGENSAIEKYMDMGLKGLDNKPVIPIRIDHYDMIYDGKPITPADRVLIAAARTELPRLVRENEALSRALYEVLHREGVEWPDGFEITLWTASKTAECSLKEAP